MRSFCSFFMSRTMKIRSNLERRESGREMFLAGERSKRLFMLVKGFTLLILSVNWICSCND